MNTTFINFGEMDWEPIREKMRKKVVNPEGCTIQIAEIEKGHTPGPHRTRSMNKLPLSWQENAIFT